MTDTLQDLEADLVNLTAAIRAGITTVVCGGQTTVFASIKAMQGVANDLERRIAECKGVASRRPKVSSIRMDRGV